MERTINNQYFIGMEVMNKEVNLTLHKIIATTNFLKMLEALQETNIESEAILTGLIACFNQQVITDKGIDKLFEGKLIRDRDMGSLDKLVSEIKELCDSYLSEVLEA